MIMFDNGARAIAEASFSAAYGYDVRAEVFGSAGLVTAAMVRVRP
jgi:myo-inositol 2-dehydrogenase / D-chiro-inositol 1-dehydrogenase